MANKFAPFNIVVDEYGLEIVKQALHAHRRALRIQREEILEGENGTNNPDLADTEEWIARTTTLIEQID